MNLKEIKEVIEDIINEEGNVQIQGISLIDNTMVIFIDTDYGNIKRIEKAVW